MSTIIHKATSCVYCMCLFLVLVLSVSSCIFPKYTLNKAEKEFIDKSSNRSQYFSIYYDKAAIRHMSQDGIYTVDITFRRAYMSKLDTSAAKAMAITIANEVQPIMNFRSDHAFIDVVITGVTTYQDQKDPGNTTLYRYAIRMALTDILHPRLLKNFISH